MSNVSVVSGVAGHSASEGQKEWVIFSCNQEPVFLDKVKQFLVLRNIPHKQLLGSYNLKPEVSFLIPEPILWSVWFAGFLDGQETVLKLGKANARGLCEAALIYVEPKRFLGTAKYKFLGYFGSYSKEVPTDKDYTIDPSTGNVFTISPYTNASEKPLSRISKKQQEKYEAYRKRVEGLA